MKKAMAMLSCVVAVSGALGCGKLDESSSDESSTGGQANGTPSSPEENDQGEEGEQNKGVDTEIDQCPEFTTTSPDSPIVEFVESKSPFEPGKGGELPQPPTSFVLEEHHVYGSRNTAGDISRALNFVSDVHVESFIFGEPANARAWEVTSDTELRFYTRCGSSTISNFYEYTYSDGMLTLIGADAGGGDLRQVYRLVE